MENISQILLDIFQKDNAPYLAVFFILTLAAIKMYVMGRRNTYRPNISDKVIIVTGSNTGIGFATVV